VRRSAGAMGSMPRFWSSGCAWKLFRLTRAGDGDSIPQGLGGSGWRADRANRASRRFGTVWIIITLAPSRGALVPFWGARTRVHTPAGRCQQLSTVAVSAVVSSTFGSLRQPQSHPNYESRIYAQAHMLPVDKDAPGMARE